MLLTVTTTHEPATNLGYLLHKHPEPEATDERCTVALMLDDVDPIRLARSRGRKAPDFSLAQYVNDRSYAASSLLGVAMADVFSTARSGRCNSRQELADSPIPLEIVVPVLPCRGGAEIAHRLSSPWPSRSPPGSATTTPTTRRSACWLAATPRDLAAALPGRSDARFGEPDVVLSPAAQTVVVLPNPVQPHSEG